MFSTRHSVLVVGVTGALLFSCAVAIGAGSPPGQSPVPLAAVSGTATVYPVIRDTAPEAELTPLVVDYESGTLDSGIPNLAATNATAPDAAYMVPGAHGSTWAIAHKVMLSDPAYVSNGYPRSESSTNLLATSAGRYYNNTEAIYTFSLSLRDWQTNAASPDEDVIWQFKHTAGSVDGRHDIALGVQRDKLWLHWEGNTNRQVLVSNVLAAGNSLSNQWIDFRFRVLWRNDGSGWFTMDMRLPGETDYGHTVTKTGLSTFDPTPGTGTFGYLKWGLYRHDGNLANGDPDTRIVYHDTITATWIDVLFADGFED